MTALPLLLLTLAAPGYPKDASPAACEDAKQGPMDVCNALADAAKKSDLDALLGHCSAAVRKRFGEKERLGLKGMHHILIGARCVRVDQQDEQQALLWVYAPDKQSRQVPLIKEAGFWRFDYDRYKQLSQPKK